MKLRAIVAQKLQESDQHVWYVNYNHGRNRQKNVILQTDTDSEGSAKNHRFFKGKKGLKINSIEYKGVRK